MKFKEDNWQVEIDTSDDTKPKPFDQGDGLGTILSNLTQENPQIMASYLSLETQQLFLQTGNSRQEILC